MVYNSMHPIGQRPYTVRDNRKAVRKREDEESSQSSYASQNQQEEPQINQHTKRSVQEEPQSSQHTNNRRQEDANANPYANRRVQEETTESQYQKHNIQEKSQISPYPKLSGQKQLIESKKAQETAKSAYNANVINSTINIAQIIKDFKNTAAAIGTPEDLTEEVNSYLTLIETQVLKEEPNVKLIRSNLKNASSLLDGYITETLQRPSNVVENWMEALFLQKINYKFDDDQVNPQFLVKFPDGKPLSDIEKTEGDQTVKNGEEASKISAIETKTPVYIPQDIELKSLFLQAKKQAYANNPKKSMELFQKALNRADVVNDSETGSKIFFEIGKIYDKHDYLSQALTSYDKSLKTTNDNNVKTKAHFSMAQIYDDVAQFDPAIDHYMSSISYAGQSENFTAQSTSLTKIGNMYTEKYNKEAFDFYSEAKVIAEESKDNKTKGYVSSNTANAYKKFDEPKNALKFYSDAIKEYKDAESPLKTAINYKNASEVMQDYGNPQKAKALLQKAITSAKQTDNKQLVSELTAKLEAM